MNKKECRFREKIPAYTDEDFSPEEMAEIEKHLDECLECSQYAEELFLLTGQLRALPEIPVSAGFTGKVMKGVKQEKPGFSKRSPLTYIIGFALAFILVALNSLLSGKDVSMGLPFGWLLKSFTTFLSDPAQADGFAIVIRGVIGILSYIIPFILVNLVVMTALTLGLRNRKIPVNIESSR